jgi:GDP-fucose protein O-fucosyltransferase
MCQLSHQRLFITRLLVCLFAFPLLRWHHVTANYYGMIDQLVASRGRIFYGCWFSTFTGYINRIRGYHADDHQLPGYQDGIVPDTCKDLRYLLTLEIWKQSNRLLLIVVAWCDLPT